MNCNKSSMIGTWRNRLFGTLIEVRKVCACDKIGMEKGRGQRSHEIKNEDGEKTGSNKGKRWGKGHQEKKKRGEGKKRKKAYQGKEEQTYTQIVIFEMSGSEFDEVVAIEPRGNRQNWYVRELMKACAALLEGNKLVFRGPIHLSFLKLTSVCRQKGTGC